MRETTTITYQWHNYKNFPLLIVISAWRPIGLFPRVHLTAKERAGLYRRAITSYGITSNGK